MNHRIWYHLDIKKGIIEVTKTETIYLLPLFKDVQGGGYLDKLELVTGIDFEPWFYEGLLAGNLVKKEDLNELKRQLEKTALGEYEIYEDYIVELTREQQVDFILNKQTEEKRERLCSDISDRIYREEYPWHELNIIWKSNYYEK